MGRRQLMRPAATVATSPAALAVLGQELPAPPQIGSTSVPRYAPLVDYALEFDGVDDYVTAPTPTGWTGATGWSAGFWANVTALRPAPAAAVGLVGIAGAEPIGAAWSVNTSFQLVASFNGVQNVLPLAWLRFPHWVYVATVYDAAAMSLTTYLNGGTLADTRYLPSAASLPTTGAVTLGMTGAAGQGYFPGLLSRLTLWKVPLAAEAVVREMYATHFGSVTTEAGLVGCWRMDEGYGNLAFDYASLPGSTGVLGGGDPAKEPVWMVADPVQAPSVSAGGPRLPI